MFNTLCRNVVILFFAVLFSSSALAEKKGLSEGKNAPTKTDVPKTLPTDENANAEVDAAFNKWSSTWIFDKYLPGSAHTTERGFKDGTYVVRGLFDFARSGTKLTIPFAAAYTKTKDQFELSNLCYNDTSSGTTDCINPNSNLDDQRAAAMQSRQLLGSIVLLGLVGALSDNNREVCVERITMFGERYFECE